jgi:1-acyl-sn-glycerol-3-phosphate acyltransferase
MASPKDRPGWFYYVGRWLTSAALCLTTRWRVVGRENIPATGPLIVVANHLSNADPPLVAVCIRRPLMFMAKKELFHMPVIGYLMRTFGAFPVDREKLDRQALRRADELLAAGVAIAMFPEGKRSRSQKLEEAFPGSALIAAHAGAPLLPVGITGTEKIGDRLFLLRHPRITVRIGRPFSLPTSGKLTKERLTELTGIIMSHIAAELPPQYRGCYGADTERRADEPGNRQG